MLIICDDNMCWEYVLRICADNMCWYYMCCHTCHHMFTSYHHIFLPCHQLSMMFMLTHQGVVLDSHDGVVGEVDKGDVHQVGKGPIWKVFFVIMMTRRRMAGIFMLTMVIVVKHDLKQRWVVRPDTLVHISQWRSAQSQGRFFERSIIVTIFPSKGIEM